MSMSRCSALNRGSSRLASSTTTCSRSPASGGGQSSSHQEGCFTWSMNPVSPSTSTREPTEATAITVTSSS